MSPGTIYEAVLKGDAKTATAATQAALDAGISAPDILDQACIPAMTEVGRLFEIGEKFVPDIYSLRERNFKITITTRHKENIFVNSQVVNSSQ